jgi:hypothetical protein
MIKNSEFKSTVIVAYFKNHISGQREKTAPNISAQIGGT